MGTVTTQRENKQHRSHYSPGIVLLLLHVIIYVLAECTHTQTQLNGIYLIDIIAMVSFMNQVPSLYLISNCLLQNRDMPQVMPVLCFNCSEF